MIKKFNSIVDFFIPPSLKIDKSVYEKSKIAVLAFIVIFFMGALYSLFYFLQGYYFNVKAFHNYLGFSSSLIGLLIIKKTGNTNFALSLIAFVGVYLVTASVYLAGGINSNDILWYTVLTAATFMFISERAGFIIFIASFLGTTFFYLFDRFNIIHFTPDTVSLSLDYRYFNFTLILAVLSFMIYILVRGNNKLQEVIQLSKEQKVREEIAFDFHDQIGNKLASLRHLSELVRMNKTKDEKEAILLKIDDNAKDVYDNFRDFIWTLDAKSDQLIELFMYLRDFADDYFKFSEVNLYITSTPDQLPDFFLPSNYSKEIVPLFKEAITNIHKHAQAKNIRLDFVVSKTELEIRLKDDGKGIDPKAIQSGNGLGNMKKRAEKTGGIIGVFSSPENGTEIIYTVILPQKGGS